MTANKLKKFIINIFENHNIKFKKVSEQKLNYCNRTTLFFYKKNFSVDIISYYENFIIFPYYIPNICLENNSKVNSRLGVLPNITIDKGYEKLDEHLPTNTLKIDNKCSFPLLEMFISNFIEIETRDDLNYEISNYFDNGIKLPEVKKILREEHLNNLIKD